MFCEVISTAASIFLSFHAVAPQEVARGWVGAARDAAAAPERPWVQGHQQLGCHLLGVIAMEVQLNVAKKQTNKLSPALPYCGSHRLTE